MSVDELLAQDFGTIADVVRAQAAALGDKPALVDARRSLSYAGLDALMDRIAAALQRDGVRKAFMLASCVGGAVTIAFCAYVEPRSAAWLLGVAGLFFGITTAMLYSIGPILAGARAAGRWAGAQNLCGQLAGVLAPWITGKIIDRTGGYSLAFAISAVMLVLAMVAFGVIIRRIEPVEWPEQTVTVERVA